MRDATPVESMTSEQFGDLLEMFEWRPDPAWALQTLRGIAIEQLKSPLPTYTARWEIVWDMTTRALVGLRAAKEKEEEPANTAAFERALANSRHYES